MRFDPQLAEIRFGCGVSPVVPPPVSVQDVLDRLAGPDLIAARFPIEDFATFRNRIKYRIALTRLSRQNIRGTAEAEEARKGIRVLNQKARIAQAGWLGQQIARRVWTGSGLRERLTAFWSDHFTATGKTGILRRAATPFAETAIRPNVTGLFENLLIAAVTHPLMQHYFDQDQSVGPNSVQAARRGKASEVNENLAREVLELHTLGVGGPYTQGDVRELATLFAGLTMDQQARALFRTDFAEPGKKIVLGHSYGSDTPHLRDVTAALRDLARHPATARHIAGKMAMHFTGDTPDPDLVDTLAARFVETGGDLAQVTDALLRHPAAWDVARPNVKPAFDFISSALRALAISAETLSALSEDDIQLCILQPMALMGHVWEKPDGPDGLPEEDSAWITPQGLAARLQWAVTVPQMLRPDLPDPRDFVQTVLEARATPNVLFAAEAAESRWEGIGLVLASPAFQRM